MCAYTSVLRRSRAADSATKHLKLVLNIIDPRQDRGGLSARVRVAITPGALPLPPRQAIARKACRSWRPESLKR